MRFSVSIPMVAAFAAIAIAQHALAGEIWTEKCRTLASSPDEPGDQDGGVIFSQIDPQLAVPACRSAVAEVASKENFVRLGRALDKAKNYYEAQLYYEKAANLGYAFAQYSLANIFFRGRGIGRDDAEAARLFRQAADQGLASAQFNLGWMYANGRGVAQDDAEAVAWYRRAADQGLAIAQYNLGNKYANGRGVAQDDAEAIAWFRIAADQGYAGAQFNLGLSYDIGRGANQDDAEAARWYRKAA
ncbi:MAG: tetratricopeptide repeat protein, partial [Alphaproteobacteria bacterium]